MAIIPYIPENITVHLGAPDSAAENVTVPFIDYVKNVASGEIYPTWPESSLRANIYAITTFALHRIFTEWYPSKGYDFDITSTTAFDQSYQKNRDVFENISVIVDEQFNEYIVRSGEIQPLFAQFCNGTTSKCNGLSQWGTVSLAEQGKTPIEILKNYYGNNIELIFNAPVQNVPDTYPGTPLTVGDSSNDVAIIQQELNRISVNYPAIPKIPTTNGIFDFETKNAVEEFQRIFNLPVTGTVNKETWYRIKNIFNGVKGLGELLGEGLRPGDIELTFPEELKSGDTGYTVATLQYYLSVLGYFNPNLPLVPITSVFDSDTEYAVRNFQSNYGLPVTGIVNRNTWNEITSLYENVLFNLQEGYNNNYAKLYPGYILTPGSRGNNVRDLQTYLSAIAENIGNIPNVTVDGVYGNETRDAVYTFQRLNNLPINGVVGAFTWQAIAREYNALVNSGAIS